MCNILCCCHLSVRRAWLKRLFGCSTVVTLSWLPTSQTGFRMWRCDILEPHFFLPLWHFCGLCIRFFASCSFDDTTTSDSVRFIARTLLLSVEDFFCGTSFGLGLIFLSRLVPVSSLPLIRLIISGEVKHSASVRFIRVLFCPVVVGSDVILPVKYDFGFFTDKL